MSAAAQRIHWRDAQNAGTALSDGAVRALGPRNVHVLSLIALLQARGWSGDSRHLIEALPHVTDGIDLVDLRNVLAALSFPTRPLVVSLATLDARFFPCLFVTEQGPIVALDRRDGVVSIFDPATAARRPASAADQSGIAYVIEAETRGEDEDGDLAWSLAKRFRGPIVQLLAVSAAIDLIALILPIASMVVFDRVIGARSGELLVAIGLGLAALIAIDLMLRWVRVGVVAYIGGRIERMIGVATFVRLLHLPPAMTESAPIGTQVARLKEFETIREFFTGPLVAPALEAPFTLGFVIALAWIGGPLVWVPVIAAIAFVAVVVGARIPLRRAVAAAGRARAQRQSFLVDALSNFATIKHNAAEARWRERHRGLAARQAHANVRVQILSHATQSLAQAMMLLAGLAALAWGSLRAIDGTMTIGALIASLALIWRILSPLQVALLAMARLENVMTSMRQIGRLLAMRGEGHGASQATPARRVIAGRIEAQRVSVRHRADAEPALIGVSFAVRPGEMIALGGASGSGKSTMIKVLAGMVVPQAGTVAIDGLDIRQLDPREVRQGIAYLPQMTHLFHGTLAQNLRLADPAASNEAIARAIAAAGLDADIASLPDALETRFDDRRLAQMPAGMRQRLGLARVYLKDTPIVVLDEPAQALDDASDRALVAWLESVKGSKTVIMSTHRPSHMRLCDRVLGFKAGQLVLEGPGHKVSLKALGL